MTRNKLRKAPGFASAAFVSQSRPRVRPHCSNAAERILERLVRCAL